MQTQPQTSGTKRTQLSHQIAITYRPIRELKLNSQNPRIHTPKQIRQIARSIQAFGFNVPVLINSVGQVIAGHGRLLACQALGITTAPTIVIDHLSETQVNAFLIADNKLTENAAWDEKLLAEQFIALSSVELDFSLEVTGFDMGVIDVLIEGLSPVTEGKDDPADAVPDHLPGSPITRLGDLWQLDRHHVYCGNALEEAAYIALMGGQQATMVFTDPPYNVPIAGHASGLGAIQHRDFVMASGEMTEAEFTAFLIQACTLMARYSVDGSLHFIFMDWRHMREILAASRRVYSEFKNLCIWVKDNAGMGALYRSQHELISVFKSGTAAHQNHIQLGQFGRYRTNVWQYPGASSFARKTEEGNLLELHPTVKPVALIADAIMDCSGRGEIVLDPFLGSGSTLMAAERTGRCCFGLEIAPIFVDTIIRRWQTFTGQTARHQQSGRTFFELQAERRSSHG